jgi:indolepyruvate ferredoxin oxidoreductase alpha subunit
MVRMVEEAFALSEASNMPAILQLRIRACHVRGSFAAKDNVAPAQSTRARIAEPAPFDYAKLAHPPVIFGHEKKKAAERIPAARARIEARELNELFTGKRNDVGLIVQGGLYNSLVRALAQFGLSDAFGQSDLSILVLNVTFPLVPEQIAAFCSGT